MITKKQAQSLAAVATTIAIVTGSIALWPVVGWQTPNAHANDIVTIEAEHVVSQEEVLDAIKLSRDEWKCDEYDEELLDLLLDQVENNSVENRRDIEKIKNKMEKLDCQRFEDFG